MLTKKRLTVLLVCICGMVSDRACAAESATGSEPLEAKGKAIVQQAFALLSANLGKALAQGGVSNALSYCSVRALPLTRIVADTNKVRLSRVTLKARNPSNKADRQETEILKQFQSWPPESKPTPILVTNVDQSVSFFAPIMLNNPLCLNCHGKPGSNIKPEHVKFIRGIYPKDAATGYSLGDLRGMWRVDFSPGSLRKSGSL